ncbi:MAG: sigma-54-dependent Fis family transcriptional regulator [Planctomycetes bacterium]|nr:sigma-54-dependent Fis family transcriptional regulator [Planctomycetota bacterium]
MGERDERRKGTGDFESKGAILIIDDDRNHARGSADVLESVGYSCDVATGGREGLEMLQRRQYDLVLTDLVMGDVDGMEILRRAQEINPFVAVIVFTGHGTIENAVEALKKGAVDYLVKPLDIDGLRIRVQKALERQELVKINRDLERRLDRRFGFGGIIGNSESMRKMIDLCQQIAETDVAVLISGENGTGKELIARAIHENSLRKKRPLVPLNCAALSPQLVESELFGHEKGAFTGATFQKKGRFEYADNGTLFLDEVGDIPLETQVKLLRVLEGGEITRVGSNEPIKVNVRIISATNRSIEKLIEEGRFREDLYYRLKVVPIHLAPLRERRQDIPLLVDHFIKDFSRIYKKAITGIEREALNVLTSYSWPGNVRELKHAIENMVVVSRGNSLTLDNLPESIYRSERKPSPDFNSLAGISLKEVEKILIRNTLSQTGGNRQEAAKILGIGERTLYRKLKTYQLS